MVGCLATFVRSEGGATAIEYAFLISMVGVAALTGFVQLGESVGELFGMIMSSFLDAMPEA